MPEHGEASKDNPLSLRPLRADEDLAERRTGIILAFCTGGLFLLSALITDLRSIEVAIFGSAGVVLFNWIATLLVWLGIIALVGLRWGRAATLGIFAFLLGLSGIPLLRDERILAVLPEGYTAGYLIWMLSITFLVAGSLCAGRTFQRSASDRGGASKDNLLSLRPQRSWR